MTEPRLNCSQRPSGHQLRLFAVLGAFAVWLAWVPAILFAQDRQAVNNSGGASEAAATVDNNNPAADSSESPPAVPTPKEKQIQYVGPDTYILLDEKGRPQPMPGMTYEDFFQAWKATQAEKEPTSNPRFIIESIAFEGTTKDTFSELKCTVIIHLLVDEPVKVPLGLGGAIVRGQPQFRVAESAEEPTSGASQLSSVSKTSDEFITQSADGSGIVAHFISHKGERREVSLNLIVPLQRDNTYTVLPINCPRAVTSNLKLTTDTPASNAIANAGTLVSQRPDGNGGTQFEIAGLTGPFELSWRVAAQDSLEQATVLGATGAIKVAIDGRSIRTNARLTIQSYGGGFEKLHVRLPVGAQLLPSKPLVGSAKQPKYTITLEDTPKTDPKVGPIAVVHFAEKQSAAVNIDLTTDQPLGLGDTKPMVELGGFEVLGALRQYGDIAINVASDWQVRWRMGEDVRQVDISELAEPLQEPRPMAAFQYDRQPWSLAVRVDARQSQIHVTPTYEMQCLSDEARLTLRLNYQVFGKRAFDFRIRMKGWEITGNPLESGGLVDINEFLRPSDDILTLPLAQASTPRAEIVLSLRRPLKRDATRLELPLPIPIAESIAAGNLFVRTTPDIELKPDLQNSTGLTTADSFNSASNTSDTAHGLHFRTLVPEASFVADRETRAQTTSVNVTAKITVSQNEALVDQRFDYTVQHISLSELVFDAPHDLWLHGNDLQVVLLGDPGINGQPIETPLNVVHTPEDFESSSIDEYTRFRVTLPQERLGRFSIAMRYDVPTSAGAATNGAWRLPLVRDTTSQSTNTRAEIIPSRGTLVSLDPAASNAGWRREDNTASTSASSAVLTLVADESESTLPLSVGVADSNSQFATIVDRAWFQSWFVSGYRQDRAAIRFRTAASQATVELSPQSAEIETEVLLDNAPAEILSRAAGRIVIQLPDKTKTADKDQRVPEHTLELRSRQPITTALLTRHRLTPPLLNGSRNLTQVYWQVILPSNEHIIRSPTQMTSASQWQWLGSFWGQRPTLSQSELEDWIGASSQAGPAASQNEYVYTGLDPVLTIDFVAAPRWLIVLASSLAVLGVAVLWIYVPTLQQRWLLGLLGCLIAVLAVAYPVPAMLFAQAATLGVVVTLLSILLKRLVTRPTHIPVLLPSQSSQRHSAPRSDSLLAPPLVATASTAPTVPLRVSDSQP